MVLCSVCIATNHVIKKYSKFVAIACLFAICFNSVEHYHAFNQNPLQFFFAHQKQILSKHVKNREEMWNNKMNMRTKEFTILMAKSVFRLNYVCACCVNRFLCCQFQKSKLLLWMRSLNSLAQWNTGFEAMRNWETIYPYNTRATLASNASTEYRLNI